MQDIQVRAAARLVGYGFLVALYFAIVFESNATTAASTVTHWGQEFPVLAVRQSNSISTCDLHVLTFTPCGDIPVPKALWRDLFDETPYAASVNGMVPHRDN